MFTSSIRTRHTGRTFTALVARAAATGLLLSGLVGSAIPIAHASSNSTLPGPVKLTATFNSIGVELFFTGDDNANATASLNFKKSTDSSWRAGLPLWRTDDGSTTPGRAFYGSVLLADAGTSYDVRVTVVDVDGVDGPSQRTGTVTTRAETIPLAAALPPTYFVSTTGNDINDGTSTTAAWQTLNHALKYAPGGAVVQVGPGYFKAASNTLRSLPITLLAQYPAIDDNRNVVNAGLHSVIDSGADSGPASAVGLAIARAPWQLVNFVDPVDPAKKYPVWKWAASGVTATQLGYATKRTSEPKRLANWARDSFDLATPAGWAKKLYTNLTYNYGFISDANDIYVRLPADADPNTLYITAGTSVGVHLDGPNTRVSGFELRNFKYGVYFEPHATFGVVDHNQFVGNLTAVGSIAQWGTPPAYGSDHVIQYNRIADSSLWTPKPATDLGIPWSFIKTTILNADGSTYPTTRLGSMNESTGVGGTNGSAQREVVRHNTIDGAFNGVSIYGGAWSDRYANQDMDVHDNLIKRISDDALEPSGPNINFRAWGNRIEDASVVFSSDPLVYGPAYVFRNQGWRLGSAGVPYDAQGRVTYATSPFFKYDAGSTVQARIYVLQNTLWGDPNLSSAVSLGGAQYGGKTGSPTEAFYMRNNIIHASKIAFSVATANMWDEDYNYFSSTDVTRGMDYLRLNYTTDVAGYRVASGQGAHTNISGNFVKTPKLTNPGGGDLTLPDGSLLIDAGITVANLSDRPGVDYTGSAPDLGATEHS